MEYENIAKHQARPTRQLRLINGLLENAQNGAITLEQALQTIGGGKPQDVEAILGLLPDLLEPREGSESKRASSITMEVHNNDTREIHVTRVSRDVNQQIRMMLTDLKARMVRISPRSFTTATFIGLSYLLARHGGILRQIPEFRDNAVFQGPYSINQLVSEYRQFLRQNPQSQALNPENWFSLAHPEEKYPLTEILRVAVGNTTLSQSTMQHFLETGDYSNVGSFYTPKGKITEAVLSQLDHLIENR